MTSIVTAHGSHSSSATYHKQIRQSTVTVEIRSSKTSSPLFMSVKSRKSSVSPAPLGPPLALKSLAINTVGKADSLVAHSVLSTDYGTNTQQEVYDLASLVNALAINEIESCDGAAECLLLLHKSYTKGEGFLFVPQKIQLVSPEQFILIRQVALRFPKHFGKLHFTYFGMSGLLVITCPCELHESLIRTVDDILTSEGTQLPYLKNLVLAQINHNKPLIVKEDTVIPDILLQFSLKNNSAPPIYPVVCQIAFSQMFQDTKESIKSITAVHPSLCMAILVDINEYPSYKSLGPKSNTWKILSQDHYLDYIPFINRSSFRGITAESGNGFVSELFIVAGHPWCSVKEVVFHVWVKAPDADQLDVDEEVGDYYAFCVLPGDVGVADVEAMLLKGLNKVKDSVIILCETTTPESDTDSDHPSPDAPGLTHLHSYIAKLSNSLQSFNKDILQGILETGHHRYTMWHSKLERGLKRARDDVRSVKGMGEGSKKLRPA